MLPINNYLILCLTFLVTNDLTKRNKKQSRNKGSSSTLEIEPITETEKFQEQVLMIEVENLKDEPYDKTMEIKVCLQYSLILYQNNYINLLFFLGIISRNNQNYSINY